MTARDDGQALRVDLPLLTETEAAAFLRLANDGRDATAAKRAMDRLVARRLIRPCLVGNRRRYSRRELDGFIDAQTERYGATP